MKTFHKIYPIAFIIIFSAFLFYSCDNQINSYKFGNEALTGTYPAESLPGDSALLFAPGIVSTGLYERDMAVSPNGDELFFGVSVSGINTFLQMKKISGQWQGPFVPSFAKDRKFINYEPAFSPDGKKLYFLTTRPTEGETEQPGFVNQNIFYVKKTEDGSWSDPIDVGAPINTKDGEFFPSIAKSGNMYFTRSYPKTRENYVYISKWEDGKFMEPVMLPESVNKSGSIYNACIAPDESFLIGCAAGREEDKPANTFYYYIFFNLGNGNWSEAVNPGEKMNLPNARCMSPSVSPDGKYLFFASSYSKESNGQELTLEDIYESYKHPQNGSMDIYWISTDFIKKLQP